MKFIQVIIIMNYVFISFYMLTSTHMYIYIYKYIDFVSCVAFSSDGIYLATGSGDKTLNLINLKY